MIQERQPIIYGLQTYFNKIEVREGNIVKIEIHLFVKTPKDDNTDQHYFHDDRFSFGFREIGIDLSTAVKANYFATALIPWIEKTMSSYHEGYTFYRCYVETEVLQHSWWEWAGFTPQIRTLSQYLYLHNNKLA